MPLTSSQTRYNVSSNASTIGTPYVRPTIDNARITQDTNVRITQDRGIRIVQ